MAASWSTNPMPVNDDIPTVCAVSLLAAALADVLHEGVGHALLALFTGAQSGEISTVAWSSAYHSRLVAAGGTLVNLAAGLVFWLGLRGAKNFSAQTRYFLFASLAFNLFVGTGYFFFSGVTNFGRPCTRIGCGERCWSSSELLPTMVRFCWWGVRWCGTWEFRSPSPGASAISPSSPIFPRRCC
jgi:hypothetical protein